LSEWGVEISHSSGISQTSNWARTFIISSEDKRLSKKGEMDAGY
jgi:hypothetical protein